MRHFTTILIMLLGTYACAQEVLINSAKGPTNSKAQLPANAIQVETLSVKPEEIQALRQSSNSVLKLSDQNLDRLKQLRDSLDNFKRHFESQIEQSFKARAQYRIDSANRSKDIEAQRTIIQKNKELAIIRKAVQRKDEQHKAQLEASKKNTDDVLKKFNEMNAKIARMNEFMADLNTNLQRLDSINRGMDSLDFLYDRLLPDLRSKVGKNIFLLSTLHTLFDSTHTFKDRQEINDTLSDISVTYRLIGEDSEEYTKQTLTEIDSRNARSEAIQKIRKRLADLRGAVNKNEELKSLEDLKAKYDNFNRFQIAVDSINMLVVQQFGLPQSGKRYRAILRKYLTMHKEYDANTKVLDAFQKRRFKALKKVVENETEAEFGALPNISYLIGETRALNLNIGVLGAFSTSNDSMKTSFESKLFTGTIPKTLVNPRSLFIPEISSFGVQVKYAIGWESKSTFGNQSYLNHRGFNFEANLVNKKVLYDSLFDSGQDLSNFTAHLKAGFEQVVVKNRISIYMNASWLSLLDNVAKFHKQYDPLMIEKHQEKNSYWFGDFGARFLLTPGSGDAKKIKETGLSIYADINFIIPGKWGRDIIQTEDRLVSIVKIGVKKSLGIIHNQYK